MKLSLSQIWELTEALKQASVSKCWICVEGIIDIVKGVLERKKFWYIHIDDIPEGMINIEDNRVFNTLLRLFIRNRKKTEPEINLEEIDIYSNTLMFRKFEEYCLKKSSTGKLTINKDNPLLFARIEAMFIDFKKRYGYHVRNNTRYYDEIIRRLWLDKHSQETRTMMLNFNTAYNLVKNVFHWKKRKAVKENWERERAFEHLKWTMEIVIRELPKPNINKIIIALLHDIKEDIKDINIESIKQIFPDIWEDVVRWIRELSKLDWRTFLTNEDDIVFVEDFEKNRNEEDLKKIVKTKFEVFERLQKIKIEELKKIDWNSSNFNNLRKEIFEIQKIIDYKKILLEWKKLRNKQYFWNLENLEEDVLYVKFADRIHNLRTIKDLWNEHKVKKIIETQHYFLDPALKEKNRTNWECKAYDLMLCEIKELLKDRDLNLYYEIKKTKYEKQNNVKLKHLY